ncbi:MAG TPA: 3-isopropylmalate dehydratase small subunit [Enteractinococcus sp.]
MEKFVTHTGVGVPLRESNVDTDQIIPAQFLKRITKTGFDDALFYRWRADEDFILNKEPYKHGTVLVTGPDFGTGSSREHAVWALRDYGFKAVISARFGDIFRSNAGKQGLVAAQVDQADIEVIWKELENNPGAEITVDLENRLIECGSISTRFQIDDYTRWRLMEGLDDIGLTLRNAEAIDEFEKRRPRIKPTTLPSKLSELPSKLSEV